MSQSVMKEMVRMKVKDLKTYQTNPNVSDVNEIAKSLYLNGQFQPIVVNIGTQTGRKNEILSGNHTFLGAKKELFWFNEKGTQLHKKPWREIDVVLLDVSEEEAAKIVIVANAISARATTDDDKMAELIQSLTSHEGTGLSKAQFDEYMSSTQDLIDDMDADMGEIDKLAKDDDEDKDVYEDDPAAKVVEDEGTYAPSIEREDPHIEGILDLKATLPETKEYYAPGYWNMPGLREDMLVQADEIPDEILAWAGSATRDIDDPDVWWLYNYGIDSTNGMKQPMEQVIMGFYTHDKYFDDWYWEPKKYAAKVLHSDVQMSLTPNYSMWPDQSRFQNLHALYRARYVGRYLQEAGIAVIPDINWPLADLKFLENHVLKTLPENVPVISMQIQTFDEKIVETYGGELEKAYQMVIDHIQPEVVILYAGDPGYDFFMENVEYDGKVIYIENRMVALGKRRRKFERKKGL